MMPCFVVPYTRTSVILCTAYQQRRTLDFIRQIFFHGRCQNTKTMSGNLRIAFLIAVISQHHFMHEISTIISCGNAFRPRFQEPFPRIMSIYRFHPFQKPDFNGCHIASLQRCRVNGHKACQFVWVKLCISLSHISTHRLPNNNRPCASFLIQYIVQPFCLIEQVKIKLKRP